VRKTATFDDTPALDDWHASATLCESSPTFTISRWQRYAGRGREEYILRRGQHIWVVFEGAKWAGQEGIWGEWEWRPYPYRSALQRGRCGDIVMSWGQGRSRRVRYLLRTVSESLPVGILQHHDTAACSESRKTKQRIHQHAAVFLAGQPVNIARGALARRWHYQCSTDRNCHASESAVL